MMALLGAGNYDFSDAVIVSVGCAGGSTGTCASHNGKDKAGACGEFSG